MAEIVKQAIASTDTRKWSWWAVDIAGPDEKPEVYALNEPTREAVIATAGREYPAGTWIAIVEATTEGPFHTRPFREDGDCALLERVIDRFCDDNSARWGEDGPEIWLPNEEIAKALNDTFERLIAANTGLIEAAVWSFTATRNADVLCIPATQARP
ncbi:hypothetical protein ACFSTD_09610 [Novosphingobium colocasiae]